MVAGNVIMAYFASWSIYGRNYNVWDMDASKLTHINYAFANIEDGLVVLGDSYADVEKVNVGRGDAWSDPADMLHGNFHQLFRLKQKHRHLKVGLSIGGWTWSGQFSVVAGTDRSRKKLVASAIQNLINYGFDYIDLDWEYPGGGGLEGNIESPNDPLNFVALLAEFEQQIKQHFPEPAGRPYVTIAAGCAPKIYHKYRLEEMAKYLKYINMMCYDFTGPWSPASDHQANLFKRQGRTSQSEFATHDAIQYFVSRGVRRDQLVLGIPIYGREFAACRGLQQPFHGTGKGTWEPGMYDYKALPMPGYSLRWERITNSTFAYNSKTKSLITFDDPRAVAFKMDYILKQKLAGTMFWEISADRATTDKKNSLVVVMDAWLGGGRMDRSQNRLCYPKSKFRNIRNNPACPSPAGKDQAEIEPVHKPVTSEQHSRIIQHCMNMLAPIEGQSANKAHAVPPYVERLLACYNQLIREHQK